jgi:sugar O-acyltransferase (sialic acid O-acetyltransferase NeuD family)
MKPHILIWGASHHARVVAAIVAQTGEFEVAGLVDDVNPNRRGESLAGYPIVGGREALAEARSQGVTHVIFGFGRADVKPALAAEVLGMGFEFATAIHPGAHIPAGVEVGPGTVIKAGAVLDPGVRIEAHAIIGANALVTHGGVVEEYARLAAGAVLGSSARVGRVALVGIGAVVASGVFVGAGALVGAGSVALRDVPPGAVVVGNPARVLRGARPDDF